MSFTIPTWFFYGLAGVAGLVVLGLAIVGVMFLMFLSSFRLYR